jgi:hypothetical protein
VGPSFAATICFPYSTNCPQRVGLKTATTFILGTKPHSSLTQNVGAPLAARESVSCTELSYGRKGWDYKISPLTLIPNTKCGLTKPQPLTFIRDKNVGAPSFAATIYFPYSTDCGRKGWVSKTFNPRGCSSLRCGCPILCGARIRVTHAAASGRKGWAYKLSTSRSTIDIKSPPCPKKNR